MEAAPTIPGTTARRNEDIALDLLKFVATTTGAGRQAAGATTGFTSPSAQKPDDQVTHLLSLYDRCLDAVKGKSTR